MLWIHVQTDFIKKERQLCPSHKASLKVFLSCMSKTAADLAHPTSFHSGSLPHLNQWGCIGETSQSSLVSFAQIPQTSGNPTGSTFKISQHSPPLLPKQLKPWPKSPSLYPSEYPYLSTVYNQHNGQRGLLKPKYALFLPHPKPSPLIGFSSHSEQKLNSSGGLQSYQICPPHLVFSSSPPFIPTTAAMQGSLFLGALAVGLTPDFWLLHFLTSLCFKSSSPNSSPDICKAHLLRSSFSTPRSPLSCVGICLFCSTL